MLLREDRVDPRVTRTRNLLAEALESLLSEKAFEDVTVQAITARATVNRATFYAHFSDKYGMVNDLFRERFAHMIAQRVQAHANDPEDALRHLFLAVTDHWAGVRSQCQPTYRRFEASVEAQVTIALRDWLYAWLLERPLPQSYSRQQLAITAALISGAIYAVALEWRKNGGVQSAEAFADAAIPLITPTIAALSDHAY